MLINWIFFTIIRIWRRCIIKTSFITSLVFGFILGVCISELYLICFWKIIIPIYPNIRTSNYTITDLEQHNHSQGILADKLYNEVNILCWVMTNPNNHKTKVTHIINTWGKRCNKLVVISSKEDNKLGVNIVGVPVGEGRKYLWHKCKEAFRYVYRNHLNEYDWFFKADDDTYVVMENVRLLLHEYDPRTPIHFGYKFSKYVKQGYMSGGGGYVMSREALRRLVEIGLSDSKRCNQGNEGEADDMEIGKCLENVGVIAGDSRDIDKRGRFFVFPPESHLISQVLDLSFWYYHYMFYKTFEGLNCCSDYAISFHYVSGNITDILDYFIYHAKPYGINMRSPKLSNKKKIYIQTDIP